MISKTLLLLTILILLASCRQALDLRDNIEGYLQTGSVSLTDSADENGFSTENITVELSCEDGEAEIWYTTDRSTPTAGNGELYTGPIVLSGHNSPIVFKAAAVKENSLDSEVVSRDYLIVYNSVDTPVFSVPGGSYTTDRNIEISCSLASADIWYTTDGTSPVNSSSRILYSSPIPLNENGITLVINGYAVQEGIPDSDIVSASYVLQYDKLSAPDFSPSPGQQESPLTVLLSSATSGGDILYTLDGTNPVSSATAISYSNGISLNWSGYTERSIRAAVVAPQMEASDVSIGYYYLQQAKSSTPSLSAHASHVPYGGDLYSRAASLDLDFESPDDDPVIFYTLDNTVPLVEQVITGSGDGATVEYNILNGSTMRYDQVSPTFVSAEMTHTIKAIAFSGIKSSSSVYSQNLILDRTAPSISIPDLAAAHDLGFSNSDNITSYTGAFQLNGTVGENADIELYQGAASVDLQSDVNGSFSFSRSLASEGSYNFSFTATDIAGNTASSSGNLSLLVDRTAPSVSTPDLAASDDQGISNSDNITNQTSALTFTGSTENNTDAVLLVNSVNQGSYRTSAASYSFNASLTAGDKSVRVQATDVAGNTATSSALTMTIDTTATANPTITVDAHTVDSSPAISWSTPAGAVRYRWSNASGGPFTETSVTSYSSGSYSVGTHNFYVQAMDTAGNWSGSGTNSFTVYGWEDVFENNTQTGSQLFGGRDFVSPPDTVGAGQGGITISSGDTLQTFGIYLTSGFGGTAVDIQLDIRNTAGVSQTNQTLSLPAAFSGGWIYWENLSYTSNTNNKFIFTAFVVSSVGSSENSGIRSGYETGATHAGSSYDCSGTSDAYMNTWSNWSEKPTTWDFWYRAYGD